MADIFVSYKREDRERARMVIDALHAEGFSTWWDDRLAPAEHWDEMIETEIKGASAVIVLWTGASAQSTWVRTEAEFGKSANKLVPVKIEPCQPPLAFLLVQAVDFTRWSGDRADRNWLRLTAWLTDLVTGSTHAAPAVAAKAPDWRVAFGEFNGEPVFDGKTVTRSAPMGTLFRDHKDLPLMRVLLGGQFKMGSADRDPEAHSSERPQRQVSVSGPFAVGVFPVTSAEWEDQMGAGTARDGGFGRGAKPVIHVSWNDACEFLRKVSSQTGERYRLLSEAEWEYACRAGSEGSFAYPSGLSAASACFASKAPADVGLHPPNAFGLYDMHGNVREWVEDLWHDNYANAPADALPWTSGHSAMRVVRGGAWCDAKGVLRSAARGRADAVERCNFIGLRIAREIA